MSVIDDYLATLNPPERQALDKLRKLIHATVPAAEEVKTYGMPGFKYKGKYLVSFAAFKDHLSLFPGAQTGAFMSELTDFKTSKGTIQFTPSHPIPDSIVKNMLLARVAAIDTR